MSSTNDNESPPIGGQTDGVGDLPNTGAGRTAALRKAIEEHAAATSQTGKPGANASVVSAPASGPNSARSSREASPIRPTLRPVSASSARTTRSRKNSQDGRQEFSPSRAPNPTGPNTPSIPSAAAVQRALSAAAKPQLQPPSTDNNADLPRPEKLPVPRSADSNLHWPVSPRLKSPPPPPPGARNAVTSPRKTDHDGNAPNISIKRPAPITATVSDSHLPALKAEYDNEDPHARGSRASARGASAGSVLETVVEGSVPAAPGLDPPRKAYTEKTGDDNKPDVIAENSAEDSKSIKDLESGNESGENKSGDPKNEDKNHLAAPSARPTVYTKRSLTSLNPNKAKSGGEGSVRSMTVETETVSSVPQVALAAVTGDRGISGRVDGGSLRLKPSNETIRPKKEKKKVVRKPTSINTGTVSSKADIFEAKVADAVDEANSSDSEETFVYESNPPDQPLRHQRRYHSRTPSQASTTSQADQHARTRSNAKDGNQIIAGKRSMKFTNNTTYNTMDGDPANQSIGRGNGRANSGAALRHHHIGRHGRGGHTSLFDGDSPFIQGIRSPKSAGQRLSNSRPSSPRNPNFRSPKKSLGEYSYDFDAEGADDERTPLTGSVRINRRNGRRPNSAGLRHVEYIDGGELGFFGRHGACLTVTILLLILILGATAFVVALSKPLMDVSVKHLQNVLASEQELMLDLHVKATNPNLFALTVSDLDVNIFAKSTFIETELEFPLTDVELASIQPGSQEIADSGIDEGNDPIEDPEGDSQTMLLGRIFEFDSPLIFDSSPFKRSSVSSVGEVRLARPGNKTEEGGTARWERVLQHPFDLIVRGVLKYQLPLSSRTRTSPIGATVRVYPKDGLDDGGAMRTGKPKRPLGDEKNSYRYMDPGLRDGVRPFRRFRFVA